VENLKRTEVRAPLVSAPPRYKVSWQKTCACRCILTSARRSALTETLRSQA